MKNVFLTISFLCLLILSTFSYTQMAVAACTCSCVNGQVRALCSTTYEIRPICAPRICPIRTPSIKPIVPPKIKPLGTSYCSQKQVYNYYTMQYEWKRVCQ